MTTQTRAMGEPKPPPSLLQRLKDNAVLATIFFVVTWWYFSDEWTKPELLALWFCVVLGYTVWDLLAAALWRRYKAWRAGRTHPR